MLTIFFILLAGALSVVVGRLVFGVWFNHVSLYAGIWSLSLSLFELRLVQYSPLEPETWIVILDGWIAFLLGSATVVGARFALGKGAFEQEPLPARIDESRTQREQQLLLNALWVVNILSVAAALQLWYVQMQRFGSLTNVMVLGNFVYSARTAEGIPGTIPYLGAVSLTGTFLAGCYTRKTGKLKLAAVTPLLATMLIAIASMGRASLLIGMVLFLSGYFLTAKHRPNRQRRPHKKWRQVVAVGTAILLLVLSAELVRSYRAVYEKIPYATRQLERLQTSMFITPSIYMYLTVHYGVLNQYLKQQDERTPWGGNTVAPVWRGLAKLGFDTYIPEYQQSYKTPIKANTGTYLREVHADFGECGVLLVPYVLGILSSYFWFRARRKNTVSNVGILSHLYVVVAFSFILVATRWGYWVVSLLAAITVGFIMDRRLDKA